MTGTDLMLDQQIQKLGYGFLLLEEGKGKWKVRELFPEKSRPTFIMLKELQGALAGVVQWAG